MQFPSLTGLKTRFRARVDDAARGSDVPAGIERDVDPNANAGSRERGRMRRRLRELRRLREATLLELGALVLEAHRHDRDDSPVIKRKAAEVATIDEEARVLAQALDTDAGLDTVVTAGVAGPCPTCGTLASTAARFCSTCGTPLDGLAASLTTEKWNHTLTAMQNSRAIVTLPRFKFEFGKKLNDPLSTLGMGIAFDENLADFDRIANRDDLYISRVEHKTFIDVNEQGTEAAAATSVGIAPTSLPPELRFDRPFLFAIRERASGAILFIGRVGDPSVSK